MGSAKNLDCSLSFAESFDGYRSAFATTAAIAVTALVVMSLLSGAAAAEALEVQANRFVYSWGDTLTLSGTTAASGAVSVSAVIYDAADWSVVNSTTVSSSGDAATNSFSISNSINDSFSSGTYYVVVTQGSDSLNMSFRVTDQTLYFEPYLIDSIDSETVLTISTPDVISDANWDYGGGNFTDLLNASISGQVHYGNQSIGGKDFHFVLVDETKSGSYDRLYVDDDLRFMLLNDSEDTGAAFDVEYQSLRKGGQFSNSTWKYIVGDMEISTGDKLIILKMPTDKPPYSTSDTVNFLVVMKNSTHFKPNQPVKTQVMNASGAVTPAVTYTTNSFGWFNASLTLTSVPAGFYVLSLNDTMGALPFPVEAFKLFASTADQSGNPTMQFAPSSAVRIEITSKNSTTAINMTSFTMVMTAPNGSTVSRSLSDFSQTADGIYTYDLDLTGYPNGRYSVAITGSDGTSAQKASTSFEVQSVSFGAEAINTQYLDEAESTGSMVDAFAPNSNVSIMTFLSNITAGGLTGGKSEEGFEGLVQPDDCNSSVELVKVSDENNVEYEVDYMVMNLSQAITYFSVSPEEMPPSEMLSQCMVVFDTPNKTGTYKAQLKMKYSGTELHSGVSFNVQRLFASGSTVDFRGDDFAFLAPNSTVRIKLTVRDLATDEELPADNITSGKIIELVKVFPTQRDILANSTERDLLNESISGGKIIFNSPNDEGFYKMRFRFSARIGGEVQTGTGEAFFMLKKYMIWGQLYGAEQGQWYAKQGSNITLSVSVLDIDRAQTVFGGFSEQKTCTGCSGFVVSVDEVRNEQQFKIVSGYTIDTGTIINTTNPTVNVTIAPTALTDMQSGWYSVDLIVNDTATGTTYFGWAGFEIRNFWVDTPSVEYNGTDYVISSEGGDKSSGTTYAVGDQIMFTVMAMEPGTGQILTVTGTPQIQGVMWDDTWPPVPISGYTSTVTPSVDFAFCRFGPESCQDVTGYLITIDDVPEDKQGNFMANVKVTTSTGSDVGTFMFDISSYQVETAYRVNQWPPLFANSELLTVNVTATDFEENPHNITNVTVEELFNMKKGRPVKMKYGQNYSTDCSINPENDLCIISMNISFLEAGEYELFLTVIDNESVEKNERLEFKVQNVVVSVPSMEEAWTWEMDSVSKKIQQDLWKADWSQCRENVDDIPGQSYFCGQYNPQCEGGCPSQQFTLNVINVSYSNELFGYIPLMEEWATARFGSVANKTRMCMYANGSHMWISSNYSNDNCNLLGTSPIALNGYFTDSAGGVWRLDSIGDQAITVSGITTLYQTGVLINTSYSRSGVIKLGKIEESMLGNKGMEGRSGLDLDGDGSTDDTLYFAIADNSTAGVYDMFFFSTDGNFTGKASPSLYNPILVSDSNRSNREFGFGPSNQRLTVLSIDARAQNLRFYSKSIGDWANIGEFKTGVNARVPVIVASPAGDAQSLNVNVTGYKDMSDWSMTYLAPQPNSSINGIGEITINTSTLGSGQFALSLVASEPMEEWKWPILTVRSYLVDGDQGESFFVSSWQPLPMVKRNWDHGIVSLSSDKRNASSVVDGVMASANQYNPMSCDVSNSTHADAHDSLDWNSLIMFENMQNGPATYHLYNLTSGLVYSNLSTSCSFDVSNLGTAISADGGFLVLDLHNRDFNVSILKVDNDAYNLQTIDNESLTFSSNDTAGAKLVSQSPIDSVLSVVNDTHSLPAEQYSYNGTHVWLTLGSDYVLGDYKVTYNYQSPYWRLEFGVAGVDSSIMLPSANRAEDPTWGEQWGYLQNVSIFGTYYDVLLANATERYHQSCVLQPMNDGECVNKVWIVPTAIGNFSDPATQSAYIGQNFTTELYLSAVGPSYGEGFMVGNYSAIESNLGLAPPSLPAIGGMEIADSTTSYFNILNETTLGYDLDKNSTGNTTFYAFAFDSDFNGQQTLTSVIVDDDLELMPWGINIDGTEVKIDFTQNESYANGNRTEERWNSLPTSIWNGQMSFGEDYTGVDWEQQPSWEITLFNETDMILKKNLWRVSRNRSTDFMVKAFTFDQQPIVGAGITVTQVARSLPWMGFQVLTEGVDYNVQAIQNVTDSYGIGIVRFSPVSGLWENGQYQVVLNINAAQGTETFERWFCVGSCNW